MKKLALIIIAITLTTTVTQSNMPTKDNNEIIERNRIEKEKQEIFNCISHNYQIEPERIRKSIDYAFKYGYELSVSPRIILAICLRESRLNPDAVSETGVKGICQMTKARAEYLNLDYDKIQDLEYGIFACAKNLNDIIHNLGHKNLCKIVAMYGDYTRKRDRISHIQNQQYYIDFEEHYKNLKFHK